LIAQRKRCRHAERKDDRGKKCSDKRMHRRQPFNSIASPLDPSVERVDVLFREPGSIR
jgi:hypothetical protein